MEEIVLDIDEPSSLEFKVKVEGTNAAAASARLVCETKDVSYSFKGRASDDSDVVKFEIPKMAGKLIAGQYTCKVEVFVENRYFVPVSFTANFKKTVSVVAEVVSHVKHKQEISVTADIVKKLALIDKKLQRKSF